MTEDVLNQDTTPEAETDTKASEDVNAELDENTDATDGGIDENSDEQKEVLPGIEIKFNKKNYSLTHEEAVSYAQKGMKYDSIAEDFQKLKDHAARNGKSISQFVAGLEEAEISVIRQQCKETADGNEEYEQLLFEKALNDRNIKLKEYNDSIASKEKEEQESLEKSIADAVISINKINPDIKEVSQIPESVILTAQSEGISIREAYLLKEFAERKAAESAQRAEESAKYKSSGSLKDTVGDEMSSTDQEFLKGLWN